MRTINAKLYAGAAILAGTTAYLAYLGATTSWQYYVVVDECVASAPQLAGKRIRVNGRVAAESLTIREDRRAATFTLAGTGRNLPVQCRGPLPDNLREDIDVVVEGTLQADGSLSGDKVLTKCASKYEAEGRAAAEMARQAERDQRRR